MGVDISGKKPIIRSPKPQMNWDSNPTQEERMAYWDICSEWEKENPGDYFRSNWWGWRPIVMLCEYAASEYELDIDFSNWGSNDGGGLETQQECIQLANALDEIISVSTEMEEETDTIYLNLGSWTDINNSFLDVELQKELNEQYKIGEVLYGSVILDGGRVVHPSHSAPLWHVKNFIAFLKECGGFEIW